MLVDAGTGGRTDHLASLAGDPTARRYPFISAAHSFGTEMCSRCNWWNRMSSIGSSALGTTRSTCIEKSQTF